MSWRSKDILRRPEWSMNRSLYKSMGYSDYDLERPLIGIANSWNRIVPGHYNLNLVSDYVKQGIYQAGGTPVEFGVIAPCDGIAEGHDGMHYILSTKVERMNRNLFYASHRDLLNYARSRGMVVTFEEWTEEENLVPFSFIDWELRDREMHVQAFHVYPADYTILKTQSIFEVGPASRRGRN